MKKIPLLLISLFLISCSTGPGYEIIKDSPAGYEIEVETAQEQAINAVNAAPTQFFVPSPDDSEAWDRAKLFYIKYLGIDSLTKIEKLKTRKFATLSNAALDNQPYLYEVRKELFGNGYNYDVKCKSKNSVGNTPQAVQNAKNLSRFIADGVLETSLLK